MDPSPVKHSDETPTLANNLTVILWDTPKQSTQPFCTQTPDPWGLEDNKCVWFEVAMANFVMICYASMSE